MKFAAGLAMLGLLLSGNAQAQTGVADPARVRIQDRVAAVPHADQLAGKKAATVQQNKAKLPVNSSAAKSGATGVSAEDGRKTDGAEIPDDAAEQSVQIKGVRG
ncbi:MAG: hypothetical protein Q8L69_11705 [Gallionellaceae bacterium]|nr:hypothetical protein [Gallionellaceae bacterium]